MPFSIFSSVLALYITQYAFGSYTPGIVILASIAVLGCVYSVVKSRFLCLMESAHGIVAFAVICLLLTIYDKNRALYDFDEFWHWGMMIKESLRLDSFYCVDESRMIIHKDYPPFLCLIEVLWCKLAFKYSEGIATTGLHVVMFSVVLLPLLEKIRSIEVFRKEIIKNKNQYFISLLNTSFLSVLLFLILAVVIMLFDEKHTASSLLADIPLAVFFGFSLYYALSLEADKSVLGLITFVLSGIVVIMTKQAGLALIFVCALLYLSLGIKDKGFLRSAVISIIYILAAVAFYYSWKYYVSIQNVSDIRAVGNADGQFELSNIKIRDYLDALQQKNYSFKSQVLFDCFKAFFDRNIACFSFTNLSYISSYLLAVFMILLCRIKKSSEFDLYKTSSFVFSITVGYLGYAFMLSVLFLFCFTADEMAELRGFQRYVDGYVLGIVVCIFLVYADLFLIKSVKSFFYEKILCVLFVLLISLNCSNLFNLMPQRFWHNPLVFYKNIADTIIANSPPDSRISFISNDGWVGYTQSYVYYYTNEYDILWGMNLFAADYKDSNALVSVNNQLKNSDYVYVKDLNDNVIEYFKSLNGVILSQYKLYKVKAMDNDRYCLEEIIN